MTQLSDLAAFAVQNNYTAAKRTAVYELSIEEARAEVRIVDGNKIPNEDGSQAIVLKLAQSRLNLDKVSPKATRINAPKDKVAAFTATLQAEIDKGTFDDEIKAAQEKLNPANRPQKAKTQPRPAIVDDGEEGKAEEQTEQAELNTDPLDDL